MALMRTHYDNLQVARTASPEVIRGAWRQLSQKWHPDKNPEQREEAERVLRIVNQAYSVLSDPDKRRDHDAWIEREERAAAAPQRPQVHVPAPELLVFDQPYRLRPRGPLLATLGCGGLLALVRGLPFPAAHGGHALRTLAAWLQGHQLLASLVLAAAALASFAAWVVALTSPHRLRLTTRVLQLPVHAFSRHVRTVPLAALTELSLHGQGDGARLSLGLPDGHLRVQARRMDVPAELPVLEAHLRQAAVLAGGLAEDGPRQAPLSLRQLLSFRGCSTRGQFWAWCLLAGLLSLAAAFGTWLLSAPGLRLHAALEAAGVVNLVLAWPWLALSARRWRDAGRPAWWAAALLVPVLGWGLVLLGNGLLPSGRQRAPG